MWDSSIGKSVGENLNFVKTEQTVLFVKIQLSLKERIVQFNKMTNQNFDQFREKHSAQYRSVF